METSVESSQREVTMSKEEIERMQAKLLESQHVATDKQVWFKLRPSNFNMILIFCLNFRPLLIALNCNAMKWRRITMHRSSMRFLFLSFLVTPSCSITAAHRHTHTQIHSETYTHSHTFCLTPTAGEAPLGERGKNAEPKGGSRKAAPRLWGWLEVILWCWSNFLLCSTNQIPTLQTKASRKQKSGPLILYVCFWFFFAELAFVTFVAGVWIGKTSKHLSKCKSHTQTRISLTLHSERLNYVIFESGMAYYTICRLLKKLVRPSRHLRKSWG